MLSMVINVTRLTWHVDGHDLILRRARWDVESSDMMRMARRVGGKGGVAAITTGAYKRPASSGSLRLVGPLVAAEGLVAVEFAEAVKALEAASCSCG